MHIIVTSPAKIVLHARRVTNCTRVHNHYHQHTRLQAPYYYSGNVLPSRTRMYVPLELALSVLAFSYVYSVSRFAQPWFLKWTDRVYINLVSLSIFYQPCSTVITQSAEPISRYCIKITYSSREFRDL
jgi:hypothetical protein